MKNIKKIWFLSGMAILAVIVTGCVPKPSTNINTDTSQTTNTNIEIENGKEIIKKIGAVTADDQEIKEGIITVAQVSTADDGWLVIHADVNGTPGTVIGQSFIKAGQNKNIEVLLDLPKVTPTLYAMLHADKGELRKYEFPGADAPVKEGDEIVQDTFNVTQPSEVFGKKEAVSEFTMTAKQWEFTPSSITVNKGDKVKLTIKSIDVDHGIGIPDFGVNQKLQPGKTVTVEFTADKTGSFTLLCTVFCGEGHLGMKGTIVVK